MTQRPQSWETGDWQPHHKNVPTHASHLMQIFFGETSNQTTRWQPPYSPDLAPWDSWLFPKLKTPLKGRQFQNFDDIKKKYSWATDSNLENCVRSWGAYFEGDWGVIVLCTMFLVSVSSSINISIFHSIWMDRPHITHRVIKIGKT